MLQLFSTHFRKAAFACLLVCGVFASASALTISPARYDAAGDPGTTVEGEFTVINEQNEPATFYTSVQNFEAQGESGTPNFTESKVGLASWVQTVQTITLAKGEKQKIPFSVKIPKDADAGGHFAAIFLSTIPPSQSDSGVSVGAKVGMLLLLKVNGEIKEGGGLLSFGLKDNVRFLTELPVTFAYRFNNSGNDRVNPTGEITIRDTVGITAAKINANPTTGNVLPNSTRRFESPWGDKPLPSDANFFDHVGYQFKNFALGFYFAKLSLTFGTSGAAQDSTIFFVFPWQLLIITFVILAIVFFILKRLVKRYNRWIIEQAKLHA